MFIFDEPFVSDLLLETVKKNQYPVLENEYVRKAGFQGLNLLPPERFADWFQHRPLIYTNSENAISWINENLMFSDIIERIDMFKNKVKFRDLLSGMYPDFYYREVLFEEIENLSSKDLTYPFIIKPSVGFFSLGVHYVGDASEWKKTRNTIIEETAKIKDYYPEDVLDSSGFIIEEVIEGVEYAVDGYFDPYGEPVVLNVLKHFFAGKEDVTDRVYVTSAEIVKSVLEPLQKFLQSLSRLSAVKNFPFHLEIRIDKNGRMVPIEMNPMRFAGWCCTDISYYAYGLNTYEYFTEQKRPDWDEISEKANGSVYALCVIEKGSGVDDSVLKGFDYEKLKSCFSGLKDLRITDHKKYGVFGFVFAKVDSQESSELKYILNSDLSEFLIV